MLCFHKQHGVYNSRLKHIPSCCCCCCCSIRHHASHRRMAWPHHSSGGACICRWDNSCFSTPLPRCRGTPYLSLLNRPQLYLVQSTERETTALVPTLPIPSLLGRLLRHYHCKLGQWSAWRNSLHLLCLVTAGRPLEISLLQHHVYVCIMYGGPGSATQNSSYRNRHLTTSKCSV